MAPVSSEAENSSNTRVGHCRSSQPFDASVPLVGWSHAQALARIADVHLVTQVRNKKAIEETGWIDGQEFTSIDSERIARPCWKIAGKLRGGPGKAGHLLPPCKSCPTCTSNVWSGKSSATALSKVHTTLSIASPPCLQRCPVHSLDDVKRRGFLL